MNLLHVLNASFLAAFSLAQEVVFRQAPRLLSLFLQKDSSANKLFPKNSGCLMYVLFLFFGR
jgi:hypothetical protein